MPLPYFFLFLKEQEVALANVVKGVAEFTKDNPAQESKNLEDILEKKMDRVEKVLKGKYQNG